MNQRVSSAHKAGLTGKTRKMTDLNKWQRVCNFGSYLLLAKGKYRRVIDPVTGRIQMQYIVNHEYEKGDIDAGL